VQTAETIVRKYGPRRAAVLGIGGVVFLVLIVLLIARPRLLWLGIGFVVGALLGAGLFWWTRNLAASVLVFIGVGAATVVLSLLDVVHWPHVVLMFLVTLAAVWLTLGAMSGRNAQGAALTLFAAFALWSGLLGYIREDGAREPDLQRVRVQRRTDEIPGYLLARSKHAVYIAQDLPKSTAANPRRHVVVIDGASVRRLVYGPDEVLPEVGVASKKKINRSKMSSPRRLRLSGIRVLRPRSNPQPRRCRRRRL
jgi:hypothetical protein